jgi:hypothetical protein
LRKLLILAVLLPVLIYAGVKGYLWYSIHSHMEDIKKAAAPVATIEYKDIRAPLNAPFGVTGITISPHLVSDTISIGSALVHTAGVRDLYELAKTVFSKQFPSRLEVSLNRISIDLNGEIASLMANNQKTNLFGTPLDAMACGDREYFSPSDLLAMGYEQLSVDTKLNYGLNRVKDSVDLFVKFRVRDAASLAFDLSIPSSQAPSSRDQLTLQIPQLKDFSINIEDLSFNERRNQYCANLTGINSAEFVDRHLDEVRAYAVDSGFPASNELLSAYRKYVTESGNITITANPLDPVDLMTLLTLNPRQLLEWLSLDVNIAGINIQEFMVIAVEEDQPEEDAKPKVILDTYKATSVAELDQHVNRLLKLRTLDGKLHHAYLSVVDQDVLVLIQELEGGSATFRVPIAQIDEVRVLH